VSGSSVRAGSGRRLNWERKSLIMKNKEACVGIYIVRIRFVEWVLGSTSAPAKRELMSTKNTKNTKTTNEFP
jgi:hypothetical protein